MKKQKYRNTYQRQLRFSLTITFGWTVLDLVLVLAKVSYPFVEVASVATVMFAFGALAAMSALEAFTDEETERQEKMLFHLNDCLSILQPVTETAPVETGEIVYWRYEPEEVERAIANAKLARAKAAEEAAQTTDSGEIDKSIEARRTLGVPQPPS